MEQNFLYKKYPTLFRLLNKDDPHPISHYGIQCDSGWNELIDNMCKELLKIDPDVYFVQIKEKFAGLRCYIRNKNKSKEDKLHGITHKYEELSFTICEACGKPGSIENIDNYLQTLCKSHKKQYLSKRK